MQQLTDEVIMKPKNLQSEKRPTRESMLALYETDFVGFESDVTVCKGNCLCYADHTH